MTLDPLNDRDQRWIVAMGELAYEKREEALARGESTIVQISDEEIHCRLVFSRVPKEMKNE